MVLFENVLMVPKYSNYAWFYPNGPISPHLLNNPGLALPRQIGMDWIPVEGLLSSFNGFKGVFRHTLVGKYKFGAICDRT